MTNPPKDQNTALPTSLPELFQGYEMPQFASTITERHPPKVTYVTTPTNINPPSPDAQSEGSE